jgi:hypothetical protein
MDITEMLFGVTPVRVRYLLRPIAQDDDRLAIGRRAVSPSVEFICPSAKIRRRSPDIFDR